MLTAALATILAMPPVAPEKFLASSERFGYTGVVSVYASYPDAMAQKNPIRSGLAFPQRDGSLYVARAMGGQYGEFNAILTNWFASPNRDGQANPNNTNAGFFQMYDADASNWSNQKGTWSKDKKSFTVEGTGKRASYPSVEDPGDYARLWNAGAPAGSGEATKGTFYSYEYKLTATGLDGQLDPGSKLVKNTKNASSYSGYFRGIFRNESVRHQESNGFYRVDLTFNNSSWAVANNFAQDDEFAGAR